MLHSAYYCVIEINLCNNLGSKENKFHISGNEYSHGNFKIIAKAIMLVRVQMDQRANNKKEDRENTGKNLEEIMTAVLKIFIT
jgi:hypothetical protein